jgi:5-methylcytosine-specific restriction protein B
MFVGPPGTGKSWYARQIALKLTNGDLTRVCDVQFHPSYQYEDFVEGYTPDNGGGFRLTDKHLLKMISVASSTDLPVVIIIDEFSRSDPARVIGEALTYMESSLRDVPFYLLSGRRVAIPKNLIFLATMNPDDRSVDEIDTAMERRWSKVTMYPNKETLSKFLADNGTENHVLGRTVEFFVGLQSYLEIGHAVFRTVRDKDSLLRLWETQIKFLVKKKLRFSPDALSEVEALWTACVAGITALELASAPIEPSSPAESTNQVLSDSVER